MSRIKSLTADAARWASSGLKLSSQQLLEERYSICAACPEWDQSGFFGTGRCQKCGCSTSAKLRMATSTCPLGKW
jgi:hypothetical protein